MSSVPQLMNRDSSPESSAFRGLRAVRISPEAPRLLMSSCNSAAGTVNQRLFGARGLSMRGETIRRDLRERRPSTRPRHSAGPPRETSTHATSCRKPPYARRKTRTPQPWGQGVHSEPSGAPVSRAPLKVGRAGRVLNVSRDLARRRELDSPSWRAQNRVLDLSSAPASVPSA
jgi:hypothetical protein